MRDTIPTVLPVNRKMVDVYFNVWWWLLRLLHGVSLNLDHHDMLLGYLFQEYIDMEEQRIRQNLDKVKYYIDASDTLYLVAGSGNFDRVRTSWCQWNTECLNQTSFQTIWPLLFLLLENDWIKFSAARKYPLNPALYERSQDTIWQVIDVLSNRRDDLERELLLCA